jgi:hypothetical protein
MGLDDNLPDSWARKLAAGNQKREAAQSQYEFIKNMTTSGTLMSNLIKRSHIAIQRGPSLILHKYKQAFVNQNYQFP